MIFFVLSYLCGYFWENKSELTGSGKRKKKSLPCFCSSAKRSGKSHKGGFSFFYKAVIINEWLTKDIENIIRIKVTKMCWMLMKTFKKTGIKHGNKKLHGEHEGERDCCLLPLNLLFTFLKPNPHTLDFPLWTFLYFDDFSVTSCTKWLCEFWTSTNRLTFYHF